MTFLTEEYIQNLVSSELTEFYIEISDSAETRARAHEDPIFRD
jgi:hypothetical protein